MKTGIIVFSATNGPFLNLSRPILFEVPPSAKTRSFAYFLLYSTNVYLSIIFSRAAFLSSSDFPRGMNTQLIQLRIVPMTGTFYKPAVGASDGLKCLTNIGASKQVTWLLTIVEVYGLCFASSL
jgi:hypothetical protein